MKYLLNPCTNPHWNMAFDLFVLENLDTEEPFFYLWQNAPAVIIGLNQNAYAEVDLPFLEENGIVLARRVTGGGAVYHDLGNLNYTFAGPLSQMEGAEGWMAEVLRKLGLRAERSGRNDILVEGRKCSGYAKRLSGNRMMVHGTLMWDVDLEQLTRALAVPGSKLYAAGVASVRSRVANLKDYLPQFATLDAFRSALQAQLAGKDGEIGLSMAQKAEINRLEKEKFGTWEWNFGHSPKAAFARKEKFPCGTVAVQYTLKHGVLEELRFQGDFIGRKPVEELVAQMLGQKAEALLDQPVGDYFDGVSPEALLTLFR